MTISHRSPHRDWGTKGKMREREMRESLHVLFFIRFYVLLGLTLVSYGKA